MARKAVYAVIVLGVLIGIWLMGVGLQRYGSVSGLFTRVEQEARSLLPATPWPTIAPTVQLEATIDVIAFVESLNPSTPTAEPTQTLPPTWTPAVESTPSVTPSLVPTETPAPSPTQTPTLFPESVYLDQYTHHWQGWNNCGPATLTTYMTAYGQMQTQEEVANALKPNPDDKNVSPEEIVAYAREQGFEAHHLINGTPERLKLLVSRGYPVMLETWLEPTPNDGFGHYRLVIGYDEVAQAWIVSDSYVSNGGEFPYRGIRLSYEEMAAVWQVFAHTYIVIYEESDAAVLESILAEDLVQEQMLENALERYQADIQTDPDNAYAWHNLALVLTELGEMEQAASAFDQARTIGLPWRMFWYQFQAYEAYMAVGRVEDVLNLAVATHESGGGGEEVYFWKGWALAAMGDSAAAEQAWTHSLWWYPGYAPTLAKLSE